MSLPGLAFVAAVAWHVTSFAGDDPASSLPRVRGAMPQLPDECVLQKTNVGPEGEFLRLLNLYRDGNPGEAVRALRSLDVAVARGMIGSQAPGLSDVCLQTASLIELELAMSFAERSLWENADTRLETAWKLSFLIEESRRRLHFQRDWLLAAGLFHHELIFVNLAEEAFPRAHRFLHRAAERYPDDPEVLLAAGALLEWSGSLRGGVASHLKEAEELYARALRLAPDEPPILLRHGLVLEKLGKRDEAAVPLLRLLELGAKEDVIYRSRMALGKIAEASGRLPEAIAHYESAAAAVPSWQVAYVALGHALHSSESHDRARTVLDQAFSRDLKSADETFMGWWSYELGLALRFEPLLERMRAEVMR